MGDTELIDSTMAKYEHDSSLQPAVKPIDMPKVLRHMGFSLSYKAQQRLLARVAKGNLSYGVQQVRKVVRMCHDHRTNELRSAFMRFASSEFELLPNSVAPEVLRSVGGLDGGQLSILGDSTKPRKSTAHGLMMMRQQLSNPGAGLSFTTFMRIARIHDEEARKAVREVGGFSKEEIKKLRVDFDEFDSDKSGEVDSDELMPLINKVFPGIGQDPHHRPLILEMIHEADEDGSGSLDFDDFLRLMRMVGDLEHKRMLQREEEVMDETHFSPHEVREFREIFSTHASRQDHITFPDTCELLRPVCALGDKNLAVLTELFNEFSEKSALLDFPSFLRLIHKVLETNFSDIKRRTHDAAAELGGVEMKYVPQLTKRKTIYVAPTEGRAPSMTMTFNEDGD